MRAGRCFVAPLTGVLFAIAIHGQDFEASVHGLVTDPAGSAVSEARVLIEEINRGLQLDSSSNSAGRFTLAHLLPGTYRLTITKAGFHSFIREGLELRGSDRIPVDVSLVLGTVTESVVVSGTVSPLDTQSASRSGSVPVRVLENVPSGGRNVFALEYAIPGVIKTSTYWGAMELYATSNVNNVQIGGGRAGENETVVDGIPATRTDRGIAYVPPLAAVGEMVVHTNAYDPQYGRTGGGVASLVLKSGTNRVHGQAYEFFKDDNIRANDWIANKNNQPHTPFRNQTFGFAIDAPVVVPRVFDGRNRAFFLLSFEGLRESSAGGQVRTLPTEAMKTGDFSRLVDGAGNQIRIYDPLSAVLQTAGQYLRQPVPGNVIPASRIDPVAAKVASFYPKANLPGDGLEGLNNYSKVQPARNVYDAWLGKSDIYLNRRSRFSARYGQTPWYTLDGVVWGDNAAEPSTNYPQTRVQRTLGADWVYTPSASLVFEVRAGLTRYEGSRGNPFGAGFNPGDLGFPASLVGQFSALEFPRFTLGTYSELGANGVLSYEAHDTWSLAPGVNWERGKHLFHAGADLRIYRDNTRQPGTASGTFAFNKGWTQSNPLRADAASGNEFASFLFGYPASGSVPLNIDPALESRYYGLFAADEFRAGKRVTVNYGLRWDYETPYRERYDRMVSGFAFDQASPIAGMVSGLALKGGLLFAGKDGQRYAFDPKPFNFQPRVGVAWRVGENWVIRGGYGVNRLGQSASGSQAGFSRTTSMVTSLDGNLTPAASLKDPFPVSLFPDGLLRPVENSQGLATNLGQAVTAPWRDRPLPYSQQYSVGLERELPGHWLLDIAYQGNLTRKLPVSLGLNFIPPTVLESISPDQRAGYFNAAVSNPMAGLLPGSALNGTTVPRQQLLYAFPQYAGVTVTDVPIGKQRYDSLLARLSQRFSNGLSLTVSFAVPKTLEQVSVLNAQDVDVRDPLRTRLEKRLAQFDVSRQFSVIGSYDLPFRGRAFRGWTVSGFFMSHTGFPMDFPNAAPVAGRSARLTDAQRDAAARTAGREQFDVSYDKWYDVGLFPRVAGPAPFTLRNFPTRFPDVRTKPLNVVDLSVYREFRVREGLRLQGRLDAHNAGNFPWFGAGLSNNVTNAGFGQLKADMGNEVRTLVAVVKVIW